MAVTTIYKMKTEVEKTGGRLRLWRGNCGGIYVMVIETGGNRLILVSETWSNHKTDGEWSLWSRS